MRGGLVAAALWLGCAARPTIPSATTAAEVTAIELDFPARDRGFLSFSLKVPTPTAGAREISWELFLEGARFASGVEGNLAATEGLFEVKTTLVTRHLAWREGEGWLEVRVEGEVDLGAGLQRLSFQGRRELLMHHRPQLKVPLD